MTWNSKIHITHVHLWYTQTGLRYTKVEGRKKLQENIVIYMVATGAPKSCFQKDILRKLNNLFLLSTHRAILNNLKFQGKML